MVKKSEAYLRKIKYQKSKSKYVRHLFPHQRLKQNEKSKLRGQEKRMKAFLANQNTVRLLEENNMPIPWYLRDLRPPTEYRISVKSVVPCPPGCLLCEEARDFLGLTGNDVIKSICTEKCTICKAR